MCRSDLFPTRHIGTHSVPCYSEPVSTDKYCVVQNLFSDYFDHLQRGSGRDGIDQQVPMNSNGMSRVQNTVLILSPISVNGETGHTCPAVSIISVAYSWPLYLIVFEKVFSIVG